MTINEIKERFLDVFDDVGILSAKQYNDGAKLRNANQIDNENQTLFVLAYAYPKRIIGHTHEKLSPSFYTFGSDYHLVMKQKIQTICDELPFPTTYGVDNHPLDERLMAELSGLGFLGKNQLIIHPKLGSYFFLGYVLIDIQPMIYDQHILLDSCKTCRKCLDACPTNAITETGYTKEACISFFNQEKTTLSDQQIHANYQLFGCDICQLACPKNIGKGKIIHPEFELSGKEQVRIHDLFHLSQKAFNQKYQNMAYLWKGKTILMRNAAAVLYRQNNQDYLKEISDSLSRFTMPWYQETIQRILQLFQIKNNS